MRGAYRVACGLADDVSPPPLRAASSRFPASTRRRFSAAAFILMTQDMRARLTSGCDAHFETGKMMIRIGCGIYGNSLSFQLMYVCVAGLRFLRERLAACTLLFCLAFIDQLASTECVQSHGNKLSSMLPEHDCSSAVCRESITRKSLRSLPPEFFVCSLWYMLMSLGLLLGVNSR